MARKRRASSLLNLVGHQPKSNYTYSESLTYRERVTPDRKIGSPNMSRRGLRGANMKQDFSTSDLSTDESGHLNLRTRTIVRPMDALSDTSDGEELAKESSVPVRRLRSSRSRSIDPIRLANGGNITRTHSTTTVTTTKTLHQGLDVESDVDDNSESAVPFRATPLTARSTTPLGRTPTPLGRAPTPVIRSSTPLRRSTTPINSHLEYLSLNNVGRGYVLTKGAIAEDVEEEEMEVPKNKVVAWSQRTWQSITWVSTVITTSIVMMAARAVTARRHDTSDSTRDRAGKSTSFMSSLTRTTRRVTTTTTDLLTSTKERIRKNPILLWIPLLFIILLLALVAYWWLLQSRTKTDDTTTDPSDGTSFLPLVMTSASELTLSVINGISQTAQSLALGISSGLLVVWKTLLALGSWLLATCSTCLHTAWVSVASMFSLLGTLVYAGLSHLLHFLYLILDLLQYLALTVLGFFTTSVSYIHGVFIPLAAKTTNTVNTQTILSETLDSQTTHTKTFDTTQETETWSITGWVSDAASLNWATDIYKGLVDGATTTKNWMWSGWMWMVLSVADALNTVATFILWLLGSLWFLACYLVSGLWTGLAYIFSGIIGFFTSTATTVSSLASATSSAVVHYSSLILMPFLMTSEDGKVVVSPPSSSENRFVASSEDSSTYIQVPKVQLEHLMQRLETVEHFAQQLEMLGVKLTKLEDSVVEGQDHNMEFQKQQASLRKEMDQLILKHQDLKFRQDELVGEVNHCCKDAIVAVENVERHLTTLLGDTFGLPGENTEGGGTAKNLAAWLSTYYVAKDELETRLTALKAAMQATAVKEEDKEMMMMMSKTATAQTTQVVMDAVLERLMVELQKQQAIMAEHAKDQVAQQVKLQVEKAAIILSEEVTNQMDQKLYNTKQQLQEGVMIAVKDSVPEHISAAIHEAVALAVSETVALEVPKAVDTKLPGMVNTAVGGAVDAAVGDAVDAAVGVALGGAVDAAVGLAVASAVSDAVEKAVTVAVTNIVTSVVPQAVANVVPQAVESALPDAVAVAVQEAVVMKVQEAVAAAVPEVVASVLPDAVTTAVNDSVVSAVSEALEQLDVSKTGGITAKVKVDGEEGMVVMAGSSPGTIPTTVNISHNSSNNGSGFFGLSTGLNRSAVMEIVKEALMKYDADKTGMVDHALESAGGNIISTRCTESYQVHRAQVSILGIPIYWLSTNNPRTIIQPDRMPGQCWAFKGSQGYIVVQLAGLVKPTGFTLEHIPKSLSPSGEIDSAPREFEVWGLKSEKDEGIQLGVYEYSRYGEPLQYFGVQVINEEYFPFIELKVNSNHGNLQYTCLYRFRVHACVVMAAENRDSGLVMKVGVVPGLSGYYHAAKGCTSAIVSHSINVV
ncbi:hypothetical protein Pcinc_022972 [Petrolisthes cinctipes]|uniref:SUN domain-containing protein n=1 Tax=Petrolisthes cinctipes TaxID=88211 RepID=A0AAE1FGR0_PETCI|nr:hypothetical protein Pcinc_022972 [Petrolisthes cinctipes]